MDNNTRNEKVEVLKLLIENKEEVFSMRKIALQRRINYKSAYNALKALEKEGIVELKAAGNTTLCSFNTNFNETVFRAEYARREEFLKKKEFQVLYDSLSKLELPLIILLFGSYAKGTATKNSDIDLLVVTDEAYVKKVENTVRIFPQEIHLTPVTYESFLRMATSKEFSVVSEAIKKNIILVGIEEYYRLVGHVRDR